MVGKHTIQRFRGEYGTLNVTELKSHQKSSSMKNGMHTCHLSMAAMRSTCLDYQKITNMSMKQILEMSLSEIINLHQEVSHPPHTWMKLQTRIEKMPTASASAQKIRLPSVQQQMQKKSPTASISAEGIRLPGAWQQQ